MLNVLIRPPLQHVLLFRHLSASRQGTGTSSPPSDGGVHSTKWNSRSPSDIYKTRQAGRRAKSVHVAAAAVSRACSVGVIRSGPSRRVDRRDDDRRLNAEWPTRTYAFPTCRPSRCSREPRRKCSVQRVTTCPAGRPHVIKELLTYTQLAV